MPRQSQKQRISRKRRSQKNRKEEEVVVGGNDEKKNRNEEVVEGGNDGDVKMNNDQNMVHYNKDAKVGGVDPATPVEVDIKDAELVEVPQVIPAPAPTDGATVVADNSAATNGAATSAGGKRNRKSNKSKKSKKSKKSRKGRK